MNLSNADVQGMYKSANMTIRKVSGKYGRTLNPDQIEDLQQEIVMRAIANYDESKATENGIGALVYKVGTTVVIDYLKGKTHVGGSHNEGSLTVSEDSEGSEDSAGVMADVLCSDPSAFDMMLSGELTATLADALGSLPATQRDAVVQYINPDAPAMNGAQRIAKMRGVEAMREMCSVRKRTK